MPPSNSSQTHDQSQASQSLMLENAPKDWIPPKIIRQQIVNCLNAEKNGQAHGAVGQFMRESLNEQRTVGIERFPHGEVFARKLSGNMDVIISTLYDEMYKSSGSPNLTVLAVGGYGRGELAPYSDIDLLFLHPPRQEEKIRALLNGILYPLWDSGIKIGHGVHTPASAQKFCSQDLVGRTAYLETRFLAGEIGLYNDFKKNMEKLRKTGSRQFVKAKLDELEARHEVSEQSRFLVEPDIKEAKGGLRDLHTIGWIYHYLYGNSIDGTAHEKPVFNTKDYNSFIKSRRFLQTIRAHIHSVRGSDDNRLTFDIQPEIAKRLNYAKRAGMSPAERLMKHYFLTAIETGRLLRIFCARLEEPESKLLPGFTKALPRKFQTDEHNRKHNVCLNNGRLDFANISRAKTTPSDWLRLIQIFSIQDQFDIHPHALSLISDQIGVFNSESRKQPEISSLFRSLIVESQNPVKTLRLLDETGLLGKHVPSFGKLSGRIIYGLYRRFTLDEQTIHAVAECHRIISGKARKEHPLCTKILTKADDTYPFLLSVFLHEIIWTIKGRDRTTCQRQITKTVTQLGLEKNTAYNVGWVSANRLLMIDTIERRTLTEPKTIEQFCRTVQSKEILDLLLVVSVCHLKVVGIHAWDLRMRRRLQALYEYATIWFDGGEMDVRRHQKLRGEQTCEQIKKQLTEWPEEQVDNLLARVEAHALHSVDSGLWGRFAPLMLRAQNDGLDGAVSASLRNDGTIEAIVYGSDRDGLLSQLAGTIALLGVGVRAVQAMTTKDNKVIDIFILQSTNGEAFKDESLVKVIHEKLLATLRHPHQNPPQISPRLGDRRSIFKVEPSVNLDPDASQDCLVVEAIGLDRPGLLYQLTDTLLKLGVIIRSAHVSTYGERAVDSFYLQDAPGYKITNKRRQQSIEIRLLNVLTMSYDD